jgi:hypothetical protein
LSRTNGNMTKLDQRMNSPRIAILNAHWSVHSSVGYLASQLASEGYAVDVYLYSSDEKLSGDLLKESTMVKVYRCDPPSRSYSEPFSDEKKTKYGSLQSGKRILPDNLQRRLGLIKRSILSKIRPAYEIIPESIVRRVVRMSRQNPYFAMIGVEKGGLAWAGLVASLTKSSLIYYSLELYTRNHPFVRRSGWRRRLKTLEEKYHRNCKLTIVQDKHRGRVLLSDNNVTPPMDLAYLPVSLSGSKCEFESQWLQEELGLAADKVIILSYGMFNRQRRCVDLARVSQSFPENWRLVFHGYGAPETMEEMKVVDAKNRVSFSLRLVPTDQRQQVVGSAQIGLAIYNDMPINDRLTGLSSEKIAMYFKCGLPLIAFRHESYEHIESDRSGILVDELDEIPNAIEEILKDFDRFVQRAYAAYSKYYCFENNMDPIFDSLRRIHAEFAEL